MTEHKKKAPRAPMRFRDFWPDPKAERYSEVNRNKIQSNWRLTREARALFDKMSGDEGLPTRQMLIDRLVAEALRARGLDPKAYGLD